MRMHALYKGDPADAVPWLTQCSMSRHQGEALYIPTYESV